MPGTKRPREKEPIDDSVHPSRKAKTQYSKDDAALAKLYNDLADDVQQLRLSAAVQLVQHATAEPSVKEQRIDTALTRLIKGVCSSRKSARLGFSIALSEILRVAFSAPAAAFTLDDVVQRIVKLTQVQGNVSGQERRDAFLGRRFAFHAVLQSGVFSLSSTSAEASNTFLEAVSDLSTQRQWLRRECGAMLHEHLTTLQSTGSVNTIFQQSLIDIWQAKGLWKSPEGVALWLCLSQFENVKLPKHVWHKRDPLHRQESSILAKVMQEIYVDEDKTQAASGSRQVAPSFAWSVVLKELTEKRTKRDFTEFWSSVVSQGLFGINSSNERKYLGLQVVGIALSDLPGWVFDTVLSSSVVHCIINHRAAEDRYLFQAAKLTLTQAVNRSKKEPSVSADILLTLLQYGKIAFDRSTKTKTIETLGLQADGSSLEKIGMNMLAYVSKQSDRQEESSLPQKEANDRMAADLLVTIVRSKKSDADFFEPAPVASKRTLQPWIISFFATLVAASYSQPQSPEASQRDTKLVPESYMQVRLMSCLAHLLTLSLDLSYRASRKVLELMQTAKVHLPASNKQGKSVVQLAVSKLDEEDWALVSRREESIAAQLSLKLLLCTTIIEVYNGDPDALSILDDIIMTVDSDDRSGEAHIVLVEILLGYISKPSKVYKRLAEQVFSSFASAMTADTLQSLYDILERNESMSGQRELFDEQQDSDGLDGEAGSAMDVEEDSDVEIVNGLVVESAESAEVDDDSSGEDDSASESSSASSDEDGEDEDEDEDDDDEDGEDGDEEAIFDRKLAEALGSAGFSKEDEDDDGSDMDDEQMMLLEPHLAKVFKERKKQSSTKQDNKDARENIINFKSRVLDLLAIFVKNAYAKAPALSAIMPLLQLLRSTSSKMLSEKAFSILKQFFDTCNKHKFIPLPSDPADDEELWDIFTNVHAVARLSPMKMHTNACSRTSLFIAKALVALDIENYTRITGLYLESQVDWYKDPKSNLNSSFFTDFTSWSITTRKQSSQRTA